VTTEALREPWHSLKRRREASLFGMWVFLATEVLFFGGLFAAYAVYRNAGNGFVAGARETNIAYGTAETFVLLTSSFAMAVGSRAASETFKLARWCFFATALLGLTFLVLKGFDYREDLAKHLFPGPGFPLAGDGAEHFWTMYWVMTLLHTVHLIIGIALVLRLAFVPSREAYWLRQSAAAEATALYWHFVDAVWVVLFPLLYLAGRA
jgi:cytochrome c oxidase subunit 3